MVCGYVLRYTASILWASKRRWLLATTLVLSIQRIRWAACECCLAGCMAARSCCNHVRIEWKRTRQLNWPVGQGVCVSSYLRVIALICAQLSSVQATAQCLQHKTLPVLQASPQLDCLRLRQFTLVCYRLNFTQAGSICRAATANWLASGSGVKIAT